jgi:sterol 3beta-glucosyltransferase
LRDVGATVRVTIFSVGTQGDVRPFLALGRGLRQRGHHVRIATGAEFERAVTAAGLGFALLSTDFRTLIMREPDAMTRGLNPLVIARIARQRLRAAAEPWIEEGWAAARNADLLIGCGVVTQLAAALAETTGKPFVQAQLLPLTPAPDLPPVMLTPPQRPLPGPVNMLVYQALRFAAWQVMRPAVNDVIRRRLGLAPYPWFGPYYNLPQPQRRILYGFSRHVVPKPARWSDDDAVTGYWFHNEASTWQPPPALSRFLASGPPPIYVGFGSMRNDDAEAVSQLVLRAVGLSGRRVIMASGWGGLADGVGLIDDERVLVIEHAPHDWLFRRVALAVHHGGAGTSAAAARAGIPSVVVPFFGDQPFWAWRLNRVGVAPPALPRQTLCAESLAAAIAAASGKAMRRRAHELARRVRAEDGVGTAIETLRGWGMLSGSAGDNALQSPYAIGETDRVASPA